MKQRVKHRRERGIALLMTLGVLSLLLIMAMSFSYQAQTERMAASNQADTSRARLLSESCMERLLAGLHHNFDGIIYPPRTPTAGITFDQLPAAGSPVQYYWIPKEPANMDAEGFSDAVVVDGLPSGLTALLSAGRWVHVKQDGKIVGRMAYLVLDESGKIDATSAVTPKHEPFTDTDGNGSCGANEHFFDVDGSGTWNSASVAEGLNKVTGGSLEEIMVDAGLLSNLPVVGGSKTRWFSLPHLLGVMGDSYYLTFGTHGYDIESYRHASGVDVHRFDLSGYAWDPLPTNGDSAWDDAHDDLTDAEYIDWLKGSGGTVNFWNGTNVNAFVPPTAGDSTTYKGSIPWIGFMSGTGSNIPEQVAANIIDYCDSDSIPTKVDTDGDGNWDVVGLERVPYLNEIAVDIAYQRQPDATDPLQDQHIVTLTVYCELVNIYGLPSPAITVALDADVEFDRKWSAVTGIPADAQNLTAEIDVASVPANTYHARFGSSTPQIEFIKTWTWGPTGSTPGTKSRIQMTVTEIKASVLLNDPGGPDDNALLDFVRITTDSDKTPNMDPGSDAPPMQYFCTVEVDDPRVNGADSDWQWKDFDTVLLDSLDGKNSVTDATSGDDTETQADPALGISTAYIRNAPMKSLWELGAIHRGEAWRTINLTALGGTTGAAYAAGDAGILDQVKIGPQTIVRGKVNANSPCKTVWDEILGDILIDDSYASPGTGTTDAVAAGLLTQDVADAGGALTQRGGLAAALAGVGTTDREKEASLGKMANFLTVRQNIFTVVVAAQAVKDLGSIDPGNATLGDRYYKYEESPDKYCAVLSEQRILATVYRDAFQNSYRVERFEFLEE